jgi:hypothetical protein
MDRLYKTGSEEVRRDGESGDAESFAGLEEARGEGGGVEEDAVEGRIGGLDDVAAGLEGEGIGVVVDDE